MKKTKQNKTNNNQKIGYCVNFMFYVVELVEQDRSSFSLMYKMYIKMHKITTCIHGTVPCFTDIFHHVQEHQGQQNNNCYYCYYLHYPYSGHSSKEDIYKSKISLASLPLTQISSHTYTDYPHTPHFSFISSLPPGFYHLNTTLQLLYLTVCISLHYVDCVYFQCHFFLSFLLKRTT